ncbi:FliM/FliN family flagellar motor switch protein [Bacillota bacterium LX-D]|nr:FliM/FliN family flagellar motor switch protein [Bacillota bacterium LX-D]
MDRNLTEEEIAQLFAQSELRSKEPSIAKARFKELEPVVGLKNAARNMEVLNDIKLRIEARLGDKKLTVREILDLDVGSVIQLERMAGELIDLFINDEYFALGEIVVINDSFAVRVSSLAEEEVVE